MKELRIRNQQRRHRVDRPRLQRVARHLLEEVWHLSAYQLGIHFVGPRTMARVNEAYLQHEGPTDVITFDHAGPGQPLYGELFICPEVAAQHAREFHAEAGQELLRYVVHGLLHLRGYDDSTPPARRRMKQVENRLMRQLGEASA